MSSHQNLSVRLISNLIVFLVTAVYVSFLPISVEENKNLFQYFHKVYKHANDESFP